MLNQNKGNRAYKLFDFLHKHIIAIIIAVVICASIISTIAIVKGDAGPKEQDQDGENVSYVSMNAIYLAMDEVSTLNPLISQDEDTYYISQLIFSSLFRLDESLNIQNDAVSSYTVDTQSGSVSLKLKENVKFSDGSSLTAEDVQFTVRQILQIGEESPYYEYASKIESVDTSGNYSLTIQFENPGDAALDNLVFPIVSSSDYSTSQERSMGSGQYRCSSYDRGKSLSLSPNKYYHGNAAENKIQFKVIPDKSKTLGLMTTDAITAYMSTSQDADVEAEDKKLNAQKINSSELEFIGFNFECDFLSDARVRKAIAKAIDTESLITDDYGGAAISADSIYFPGFLGTKNEGDAYPQNQSEAAELLSECGYVDTDEDGILEDKKGKKVQLSILVNSNRENRADAAYSIAEELQEIGIDAEVESVSWSTYRSRIRSGDFDLYIGGYKFDKKYDLSALFSKNNSINYRNQQILDSVEQLETCLTAEGQKKVYQQLKKELQEDLPYYCLCYKVYTFVTVEHFNSEESPTFFDIYRGCSSWTWEKTVVQEDSGDEEDTSETN